MEQGRPRKIKKISQHKDLLRRGKGVDEPTPKHSTSTQQATDNTDSTAENKERDRQKQERRLNDRAACLSNPCQDLSDSSGEITHKRSEGRGSRLHEYLHKEFRQGRWLRDPESNRLYQEQNLARKPFLTSRDIKKGEWVHTRQSKENINYFNA